MTETKIRKLIQDYDRAHDEAAGHSDSFQLRQKALNKLVSKLDHLITTATKQAREEERAKALEIARSCVINRKVGSPCPLVITEKMYEQVLKVGMTGVEALSKKGSDVNK